MNQAAELERYLFDHRVCSRLFANEADLWAVAGVDPSLGEHSFSWTNSRFPDSAKIRQDLSPHVKKLVLVGMGGATLSATAYASVDREGFNRSLHVLNSTSPDSLASYLGAPHQSDTHYIIASKSGETLETLAIARSLMNHVNCSESFTVITDPGSSTLSDWANQHGIRIYSSDPYVPGRYSALTNLALIPAAMLGIDVEELQTVRNDFATAMAGENSITERARQLAAALALVCTSDIGELHIDASQDLLPVAQWIEQIVAESLSKFGLGVLPVVDGVDPERNYGGKIKFQFRVAQHLAGSEFEESVANATELAYLFLLWQSAVTMAAYLLEIDPYDQPEVDLAKQVSLFPTDDQLSQVEMDSMWSYRHAVNVCEDCFERSAAAYLDHLATTLSKHDYIAILAFVNPTRENETELAGLASLLESLFRQHQVRVVYSFGPQYLHSTGQFHKATAKAHLASLSKLTPDSVTVQEAGSGIERERQLRKNVYRTGHFIFVEAADSVDFDVAGQPYMFAQMIKQQARMDARHMKMSEQLSGTTPSLINCGVDVAGCLRKFSAFLRRTEV